MINPYRSATCLASRGWLLPVKSLMEFVAMIIKWNEDRCWVDRGDKNKLSPSQTALTRGEREFGNIILITGHC